MDQQGLLYEDRFLESWAGPIITNPSTAIVELVANGWDAYATQVSITLPDAKANVPFSIVDNGKGMTLAEFQYIWRAMSYDRIAKFGTTTEPPSDVVGFPRPVFGKNGKGRFASFCFATEYTVTSRKDGEEFTVKVSRTPSNPLVLETIEHEIEGLTGHGTEIRGVGTIPQLSFSDEQARQLLGSRFLANPAFEVYVHDTRITFNDIPTESLSVVEVDIPGAGKATIHHIDARKADKSTKQHGIAWWVLNRAVGDCAWRSTDYSRILDGRSSEAKRYTFIVQADFLKAADAVKEDWSWFKDENPVWAKVRPIIQDKIRGIIADTTRDELNAKRQNVLDKIGPSVKTLGPLSKERVNAFVHEVVEKCPNFGEQEILQLSTILTKLEKTKSRFGLLDLLHVQASSDLDALHNILTEWTVGMAKIALDEIQTRLKLISELKAKVQVPGIDEVHELQPLFEKGLWMFGPQFESIEFTANRGMTTVIRDLFGVKGARGTLNRPDFVILPDSSVGFYACSSFDEEYNEAGVAHVIIVDLKTTGLALGSKEKEQVWKYVKELKKKGIITRSTKVDGFILGDQIEQGEGGVRTEDDDQVKIRPLRYDTILVRAERRMLNLHHKVKDAPFLLDQQMQLETFLNPQDVVQDSLLAEQ
ncbi:hypothetical protein AWB71_01328 [Caballeronia peredens]|nr:hypothetical protein AWB71_01328 [Caballeronia peredens]